VFKKNIKNTKLTFWNWANKWVKFWYL